MDYTAINRQTYFAEGGCYSIVVASVGMVCYGLKEKDGFSLDCGIGGIIAGVGCAMMARQVRYAANTTSSLEKTLHDDAKDTRPRDE